MHSAAHVRPRRPSAVHLSKHLPSARPVPLLPPQVTAALQGVIPKMGIPPAMVGSLGTKQYLQCDGTKPALDACLAKCPTVPKVVCGANGKTYRSRCAALCYGTTVRRSGKC